ncbi:hypothetical protein [Dendronalium phyllosphericum]|nr:hypothetical protein [Dendronalium phyllosphericum]
MSEEITNNIPEPDPGWDYYVQWHKLPLFCQSPKTFAISEF